MAYSNFVIQNGLTVGGVTIDATSGNITTNGVFSSTNSTYPATFGGSVVIAGNLIVNGSTTTINSTTMDIDDLNITLAKGSGTAAASNGAGITIEGPAVSATILYTSATDSINFNKQTIGQFTTSNLVSTGGSITGMNAALTTAVVTNFSTANAQITGGSIGGSHSGNGAFTTLTATNLSSGNLQVSGAITPNGNATINIGSTSAWFATIYGVSTQAKYADLAENYQADMKYLPGQVLEFGGDFEVTLGTQDSKRVAGVVSTNPAHLMNGQLSGSSVVALALTGRVPCNVIGPVYKGDLMVSAGFGFAKSNNNPDVGQVIGKALENFSGAKGQIEVVVGRF